MTKKIRITGLHIADLVSLVTGSNPAVACVTINGYLLVAGDCSSIRLVDDGIEISIRPNDGLGKECLFVGNRK